MRPDFVQHNETNETARHSVFTNHDGLSLSATNSLADFQNRLLRQFGLPIPLRASKDSLGAPFGVVAGSSWQSSFFFSVLHVHLAITFKKMRRIAARWIIAMMQNRCLRPLFTCQEKGNSRRYEVSRFTMPDVENKVPIPFLASLSLPFPTVSLRALAFTLVNVFPKPRNINIGKNGWCKIDFKHVVKAVLSDVLGLNGAFSASRQAAF